jgi:hypothetical protein
MAISLSNFLLPLSILALAAQAATVTYDFDVAWTYANPDGQYNRPVIGINGQWPIPPIVATKGDQVVVNVKNSLINETTSLHFHGLYMNGSTHMMDPLLSLNARFNQACRLRTTSRSTSLAHTGITVIQRASIQMVCVDRSLYKIQRARSRISMMKRLFLHFLTGIMSPCPS